MINRVLYIDGKNIPQSQNAIAINALEMMGFEYFHVPSFKRAKIKIGEYKKDGNRRYNGVIFGGAVSSTNRSVVHSYQGIPRLLEECLKTQTPSLFISNGEPKNISDLAREKATLFVDGSEVKRKEDYFKIFKKVFGDNK